MTTNEAIERLIEDIDIALNELGNRLPDEYRGHYFEAEDVDSCQRALARAEEAKSGVMNILGMD